MLVYRVEMEDGLGPYRSNSDFADMGNMYYSHGARTHPTKGKELGDVLAQDTDLYCGCQSLDKLKSWFRGFLTKIKKNGGKIVKYKVPKNKVIIGHSGKQVFFYRNCAKIVA